jgi:hypothetical protein
VLFLRVEPGFRSSKFLHISWCRISQIISLGLPQTVTFTARNNLPLPDPRYLALHAACANVAHLSGAGEYIDSVDRDIDAIRVLVKDGSSNMVLAKAMTRIWITA